jgi:hypothetical protein
MHTRLSDAFEAMDRTVSTPLRPEMDVFVTATDIQGVDVPIQLADKVVSERRHKSVFHLGFRDGENHFAQSRNWFLALAARATSAFPFAFEPVCMEDAARPFIDGGFLDNKPFSHAVEALSQRIGELPAVRKLVYIEPSGFAVGRQNRLADALRCGGADYPRGSRACNPTKSTHRACARGHLACRR